MNILVIGGTGFIGTHIVDYLLQASHTVHILSRSGETLRSPVKGVSYHSGSLLDTERLSTALEGIDAVIHCASSTVPSTANKNPKADIETNLLGLVGLLKAMREREIKRLVFLSSGGTVYGVPQMLPIPETHPLKPISSYGIVKVAMENYIYMEQQLHGLRPIVLRASNPYGPRQGGNGVQGVIGTFLRKTLHNEPIEIWGDGSVVRDFIYITDLAELVQKIIASDRVGTYNAGNGVGHSLNQIVDVMRQATNITIDPIMIDGRPYDVPKSVLDISLAKQHFDWTPRTSLLDGMKDSLSWLK